MIEKVIINDNTNTPFGYTDELDAFYNGREFDFKTGVNIIIGENGSGKSTLLNIISQVTLCHRNIMSTMPNTAYEYPNIIDNLGHKLRDGVDVKCDYLNKVFRFRPKSDFNHQEEQNDSINFNSYLNSMNASVGEQTMVAVNVLFDTMFSTKDLKFPIDKLFEAQKSANDVWSDLINKLLKYYKRNAIKMDSSNREFTILMDEPDRNLDIENLKHIYSVLSFHKEYTQIIACVHNPILIYKLSKLEDVNIIEMEEGYLDKVRRFVEWGVSKKGE